MPIPNTQPIDQGPTEPQSPSKAENGSATPDPTKSAQAKKNKEFRSRILSTKEYRRKLIPLWSTSIDYRRGKPFAAQPDDDQVAVNLDWSMTRNKQAALFSQVPQIHLDHAPDTLPKNAPWAAKFERQINDRLAEAGIEATMDEVLPDCINAAGIGVALVTYESITEEREVPKQDLSSLDPQLMTQVLQTGKMPDGSPVEMDSIPYPIDYRYSIKRISPADFLWPTNVSVSNFDNAPWLGRSGRITWAEAKQRWKLADALKAQVLSTDYRTSMDRLSQDMLKDRVIADEVVNFDEIWYKEYLYDEEAKSYFTLHHLVFVDGLDDPVVDEPWKGQHVDENGQVIGARRFPIRVLSTSYITDESIPPSDSSIGRPQVNEINKARTQMIMQRQRSLPVRWVDWNRIDPSIMQSLMRGTWQAFIPVQGDGSRVIGEVTKAAMPQENFLFDKIAKNDYQEAMGMGQVSKGVEPQADKTDPNQNVSSFNNSIGRDRAKVVSFVLGIAEVLGGLMCLYEDPQSFGEGFDPAVSKYLKYSILVDSTVLLDATQRLERLNQFVNTYAKSGWINIEPVLQEIATLTGLDPSIVVQAPQPKPPVEPNISLRLTGAEDILQPLTLAFLIKSGQAPDPKLIEQAKQLIQQAVTPPGGQPQMGPDGVPLPPTPGAGGPVPPTVGAPQPGMPTLPPPTPRPGDANPQWTIMPTLDKRSESGGKQ